MCASEPGSNVKKTGSGPDAARDGFESPAMISGGQWNLGALEDLLDLQEWLTRAGSRLQQGVLVNIAEWMRTRCPRSKEPSWITLRVY